MATAYMNQWINPELAGAWRKWLWIIREHKAQGGWMRWVFNTLCNQDIRRAWRNLNPNPNPIHNPDPNPNPNPDLNPKSNPSPNPNPKPNPNPDWRTWYGELEAKTKGNELLEVIKFHFFDAGSPHAMMKCWKRTCCKLAREQKMLISAVKRWRHPTFMRVWRTWRKTTREVNVMKNVMRTLINMGLRAAWNQWAGINDNRKQIKEAGIQAEIKIDRMRMHRGLRLWWESMIDGVVSLAAAWRHFNQVLVKFWYIWRKEYFRDCHGVGYMRDVTKGTPMEINFIKNPNPNLNPNPKPNIGLTEITGVKDSDNDRIPINMSRKSIGADRILPKKPMEMGMDWFTR